MTAEIKDVSLNGILVPVEVYYLDRYIPFYEPPYYTEDYPLYEQTEVEALRTYASEGDDVVIIGGGFGVTAVVAAQITGGTVTVFEPDEKRIGIMERTFQIHETDADITLARAMVTDINLSSIDNKSKDGIDIIPPQKLPDADVFEIDCEGAETTILKRMEARPSIILVETHNNHDEVANILKGMDYDLVEVVRNGAVQHPNCTHIRAKLAP
jgi:protein-L-isoaspartate O-methyltransferase